MATAQVGGTLIAAGGVASAAATTGGLQLVHVVNPQTSVQHPTPSTTTAAGAPAGASTDATNKLQAVHVQVGLYSFHGYRLINHAVCLKHKVYISYALVFIPYSVVGSHLGSK